MLSDGSNYDLSRLLIDRGSDIGARSRDGRTPLHTFSTNVTKRILHTYREWHIDYDARDNRGMTIALLLAWSSKTEVKDMQHLSDTNPSALMVRDIHNRSVLHFAAQRGNTNLLTYFLNMPIHVDIHSTDCEGASVLHYAVESRRTQVIDLIYSHSKELHVLDRRKQTVLHRAVGRDNVEAVKRIIELGGLDLLESRDVDGMTPLQLARQCKARAVIGYLTNGTMGNSLQEDSYQLMLELSLCHEAPKKSILLAFPCLCGVKTYRMTSHRSRIRSSGIAIAVALWLLYHLS